MSVKLLWIVCLSAGASGQPTLRTSDGLELRFAPNGGPAALAVAGLSLPAGEIAGGFFAAHVKGDRPELVANGSLERDADGDGVPDGFRADGVWKRDRTVARTGAWSMKAHVAGPKDGMSGSFGIVAPVEGGATYLASFWLKCRDRAGGCPASVGYMQQQNAKGERTTRVFQQMMSGGVQGTSDWRPVRMLLTTEPDTRRLYFRTDIYRGRGTLWADDFSLQRIDAASQPVPTRAKPTADGVVLTGEAPDLGLRVHAAWTANGQALKLSGRVTCTAEGDRCIRLSYRLPVDARGGVWGSDIGTAKAIRPGARYARTASFSPFGPFSIYPFSSVTTADRKAAVSLAVPMHPPRPFRLCYGADAGLCVEWDFGLSALPKRFPRSADFHAVLYRHDPRWGFRSAAERYYRLFPDCFRVRVNRFGNWYYHDLSKLPHPEDFGFAYNEMVTKDTIAADRKLGYLNFAYTEPWGWWGWALGLKPKLDAPAPPYEEMVRLVKAKAAEPVRIGQHGGRVPHVARQILNCGIYDKVGQLRLRGGYVAKWGGYNWPLNASPYAAPAGQPSRFQATTDWEIEPKLALGATGIYLDSIVGSWANMPNFRPSHLAASRHPLTFSMLDPAPAQMGVWHHYEFVEHLSADLHQRGKLLMANIFPYLWVFFNHQLDVMGHEVWGADNLDKMRAERTLAYHKPYTWLMQQGEGGAPEKREQWMQAALLYGIGPNLVGGSRDPSRYEKWRPLYKKYMPTIIALCEAGWEPVTHATAAPAGVLIERFGPKAGKLFFTVRNDSNKRVDATLTIDHRALGAAAPRRVVRLPGDREIPVHNGQFHDAIDAHTTCAYRVLP